MQPYAQWLKEERERLGKNKEDFARTLGIDPSTMSGLERGARPRKRTRNALIRFFGTAREYCAYQQSFPQEDQNKKYHCVANEGVCRNSVCCRSCTFYPKCNDACRNDPASCGCLDPCMTCADIKPPGQIREIYPAEKLPLVEDGMKKRVTRALIGAHSMDIAEAEYLKERIAREKTQQRTRQPRRPACPVCGAELLGRICLGCGKAVET